MLTKSGWTGVLTAAHSIDDGLGWLESFASTWGDAVNGRILGATPSSGPRTGYSEPVPTAYLAYTTGDLRRVPSDDRGPIWLVDETITRYLAERTITWAYTRDGRQYLRRGSDWWVEPINLEYAEALAQGIVRYTSCDLVTIAGSPERHRSARLLPQGSASYQVVDPAVDWKVKLSGLRETLLWTPPNTDLGFIRYTSGGASGWDAYHQPWPFVSEAKVRYNRPLLSSFVPDVNGIQLLTDAHLEQARDLSGWLIEDLGGGRHLVEWPDLAAWYSQAHPDPAVLAKAREDFEGMILTPELIEEHDPWRDAPGGR